MLNLTSVARFFACVALTATLQAQTATIIQANVNGAGQNIVGDAANEPSIAVDPTNPNRLAIGWRQFDSISSNFRQAGVAYSTDAGRHWTKNTLTPGTFRSDPVLDCDPNGEFFYYSLTTPSGGFEYDMFHSTNGGASWTTPPTYAYGGDKGWMTIDHTTGVGRGNIYAFWNQMYSCCGAVCFTRSTDHGLTFNNPITLPEQPYWGTLAVGPDGELYAFGDSGISAYMVILRSDNAQNPAQTPTFNVVGTLQYNTFGTPEGFNGNGPNPGGLDGQGWIAVDRSNGPRRGWVYVVWSVTPPNNAHPIDVRFTRSTDGGHTWSAPISINTDAAGNGAFHWFSTLSVAPNGRIDVVWNDTRGSSQPNLSRLYYSSSSDGGVTWTPNTALSAQWDSYVGWPQQNKIGDYSHMVSDNDGANLAWASTLNGEQDVYFVRIGQFPCWGDLNGDRVVSLADLTIMLGNYGLAVPQSGGDLNSNGVVDLSDLSTELALYGTVCP